MTDCDSCSLWPALIITNKYWRNVRKYFWFFCSKLFLWSPVNRENPGSEEEAGGGVMGEQSWVEMVGRWYYLAVDCWWESRFNQNILDSFISSSRESQHEDADAWSCVWFIVVSSAQHHSLWRQSNNKNAKVQHNKTKRSKRKSELCFKWYDLQEPQQFSSSQSWGESVKSIGPIIEGLW